MKKTISEVVKMILESAEVHKESQVGVSLVKAALKDNLEDKDPSELNDIEKKIILLGEEEKKGNLAYFLYSSWKRFDMSARLEISMILDPLFWSGVYFKKDLFEQNKFSICSFLEKGFVLTELCEGEKTQFYVSSPFYETELECLSDNDLKKFLKSSRQTYKSSYCYDKKTKEVFIKDVENDEIKVLTAR